MQIIQDSNGIMYQVNHIPNNLVKTYRLPGQKERVKLAESIATAINKRLKEKQNGQFCKICENNTSK